MIAALNSAPDARLQDLMSGERSDSASTSHIDWPREGGTDGTITFVSHGAVIGVQCTRADVLHRVAASLPTGARLCDARDADALYSWIVEARGAARPLHIISMICRRYVRSREIARTSNIDKAISLLTHDAEFRVAMYAPDDVFIHAAAVSWCGRTILLPGRSFTGKSTLAAELVRQGAPYYSDEYAVIDTEGRVQPFPRRFILRSERGTLTTRPTAEELGGTRGSMPLLIGCVVMTKYVPGADWLPVPMSRGEIVLALLANAIDVQTRPTHVLARLVDSLHSDAIGLTGDRGDVAVAARQILNRVAHAA